MFRRVERPGQQERMRIESRQDIPIEEEALLNARKVLQLAHDGERHFRRQSPSRQGFDSSLAGRVHATTLWTRADSPEVTS